MCSYLIVVIDSLNLNIQIYLCITGDAIAVAFRTVRNLGDLFPSALFGIKKHNVEMLYRNVGLPGECCLNADKLGDVLRNKSEFNVLLCRCGDHKHRKQYRAKR